MAARLQGGCEGVFRHPDAAHVRRRTVSADGARAEVARRDRHQQHVRRHRYRPGSRAAGRTGHGCQRQHSSWTDVDVRAGAWLGSADCRQEHGESHGFDPDGSNDAGAPRPERRSAEDRECSIGSRTREEDDSRCRRNDGHEGVRRDGLRSGLRRSRKLCRNRCPFIRLRLLLCCSQMFLQNPHAGVDVLFLQQKRREEAQHGVLRHVDEQAIGVRAFQDRLARNG